MAFTFFYLQLAYQVRPGDAWRQQLRSLVGRPAQRMRAADKTAFYHRVTKVLLDQTPHLRRMCWDLVRAADAKAQCDEWIADLEDTSDVPEPTPLAADPAPRHVAVTLLLLTRRGSNADLALGELCDLPEPRWLERATARRLLAGIADLGFSTVVTDAVYAQPNVGSEADEQPGMTAAELDDGWDHLAQVLG